MSTMFLLTSLLYTVFVGLVFGLFVSGFRRQAVLILALVGLVFAAGCGDNGGVARPQGHANNGSLVSQNGQLVESKGTCDTLCQAQKEWLAGQQAIEQKANPVVSGAKELSSGLGALDKTVEPVKTGVGIVSSGGSVPQNGRGCGVKGYKPGSFTECNP